MLAELSDLLVLLVLLGAFVALLSVAIIAKAHGVSDSDLSPLRNIDGALGVGLVGYIAWFFARLISRNRDGDGKGGGG